MVSTPWYNRKLVFLALFAGLGFLCALVGCQSLPRSGFDPSGQRLFESRPLLDCPLFNRGSSSPPTISSTPPVDPWQQPGGATIYSPPPPSLPGELGAARTNPAVPMLGSTATSMPPGVNAVTTAMILSPDAGPQHVFADTGGYALPVVPVQGPALIMTPREQIAPLGSEVVLVASYLGSGERLITNEKIEWTLEGVGTIGKIDTGSHCDLLLFDTVKAKKVSDQYAITKTSATYQTLDRGTPDTTDDVHLLRGQTWVSANSMKEGTTHVTAFAPNMADWSKRTDVGIIHWVDAQWVVPRLPIAPVGGSRNLTTTILRASNGQPRQGWIVRYEILGGPAAGLGGTGAQVQEIETDVSGQAITILTPRDQQAGTNTIRIQIIRPAGLDGDRRVTVGSETVRQTWSGSPNVVLDIRGPSEAGLGQDVPYEITAENRLSTAVSGVIALPIPPMASYIRSEPPGVLQGSTVLWTVDLPPNSTRKVNVVVRQGTGGSLWLQPEFHQTGRVTSPGPAPSPFVPSPGPPDQGAAILFQGTPSNPPAPPPIEPNQQPQPPPPSPPATTFQRPSLAVQIEADPESSVVAGLPFLLHVNVTNTGTTHAEEVTVLVPLPQELRSMEFKAAAIQLAMDGTSEGQPPNWVQNIDGATFRATLHIPVLSAGKTAQFLILYPRIDQQGYNITCIALVGGQEITRETQHIRP